MIPVRDPDGSQTFRLAPMSPLIRGLTWALLPLPVVLLALSALTRPFPALPGVALAGLYAWIWLGMRPTRFEVSGEALHIVWPLRRRRLSRGDILGARVMGVAQFREEAGRCLRVGAGGLWGGFGLLWTRRRGLIHMYVSRADGLVWLDVRGGRPWLLTPERPEVFSRAAIAP